jgi:hypothetical protein
MVLVAATGISHGKPGQGLVEGYGKADNGAAAGAVGMYYINHHLPSIQ